MRAESSRILKRFLTWVFPGVLLGLSQPACHLLQKPESKAEAAAPVQPGMFTLSADQLSHLKTAVVGKATWDAAVHTTGTVDWDADHTTQAITQVNGPISRILVDTGTPVKEGEPLLYVSSPDRRQRRLRLPQGAQPRSLHQAHRGPQEGTAGPAAPSPSRTTRAAEADYNDALTDVQNSLQALRIFGITAPGNRPGREAGHRHRHRTGGALAHRRRDRAETGLARPADSGRPDRLLHDQRRLHRLGAGPHLRPRPAHRCASAIPWRKPTRRSAAPSTAPWPTSARSSIRPRAPRPCAS